MQTMVLQPMFINYDPMVGRFVEQAQPTGSLNNLKICIQERLQAHHAAMDFSTGSGGRIISDPMEAALIAKTGSKIRSLHPCLSAHQQSSSMSSLQGTDQPLSTVVCSEPWFRPALGREQANLALFPHRASDGVFLIRACSRLNGGYVLSFTTHGKIVHAQIVRVSYL